MAKLLGLRNRPYFTEVSISSSLPPLSSDPVYCLKAVSPHRLSLRDANTTASLAITIDILEAPLP